MPRKRRNQSRTLPNRQCKKPKILSNLRTHRDQVNYDETGYDLLDYLDETELIDIDDSTIETSSSFDPESLRDKSEKKKKINAGIVRNAKNNIVYLSKRTGFIDSNTVYTNLRSKSSKKSISMENAEQMFIVEKILDMKKIEGNRLFLLKWEGFSEIESSWEPEANIESKDIIKEYLEELQRMKKIQKSDKNDVIVNKEIENESENGTVEINDVSKSNVISDDKILNIEDKERVHGSFDKTVPKPEILSIDPKPRKSRKKMKRSFFHKKKNLIKKEIKLDLRGKLTPGPLDATDVPAIVTASNEEKMSVIDDFDLIIKDIEELDTYKNASTDSPMEVKNSEVCHESSVTTDNIPEINITENDEEIEEIKDNICETIHTSDGVESSQSNKENEVEDLEKDDEPIDHNKDNNVDKDEENESEDDDDDDDDDEERHSIYEPKSDLSDEEFNTESRKKSKTGQNNLNTYFPENLPQNVQEIFQVEKILRMRWNGGMRYFYLKWEGFPDTENSWEPEENLECPELIEEFLETLKKPKPKIKLPKKKVLRVPIHVPKAQLVLEPLPDEVKIKEPVVKPKGFPKDREPELILGSGVVNDELNFLIKWKNIDMANLVPAKRANIECPQAVIRFYENNLMWHNNDGSITTTAGDRITVSEESEEQKRQRIEAKKETHKCNNISNSNGTPRKVGRPSTKSVAPGLIQSRKLTTGASRMLNLINNFQSNRTKSTVTESCQQPSMTETDISVISGTGSGDGRQDRDNESKGMVRSQSDSVDPSRITAHGLLQESETYGDPYEMPDDSATKIHLLSVLSQRAAAKPVARGRPVTKQRPMPPPPPGPPILSSSSSLPALIDLTDDSGEYQCPLSVATALPGSQQYESRDLPRQATPPADNSKFDFPKPNLHHPSVAASSSPSLSMVARQVSPFYQPPQPASVTKEYPPPRPPMAHGHQASPAINQFKPLYPSQSYPSFNNTSTRAISPLGGTPRPSPDQRPLQQMMSLSLQQSFANSSAHMSPSAVSSVKQQLQHNLTNNQMRTLAQYQNNTAATTNDPSRQQRPQPVMMSQQSYQVPATGGSFLSSGQSTNPQQQQYLSPANIQYQSPLVPNNQLLQQQQQQLVSNHNNQSAAIIYQQSQQYPSPGQQYQYIVNTGNNYQPVVTNTGNSFSHMANNQNQQMYYPNQGNPSSLRSILPRKPEYQSPNNNQMSNMINQQSQLQTEQSNQLLINSYLNLGAYL